MPKWAVHDQETFSQFSLENPPDPKAFNQKLKAKVGDIELYVEFLWEQQLFWLGVVDGLFNFSQQQTIV